MGSESNSLEDPPSIYKLSSEWEWTTLLGTRAYQVKQELEVETPERKKISRNTALISISAGILWQAAAERTESKFEREPMAGEKVECYQVISKVTFASGFKSLEVTVGANGWALSVAVTGSLGESGTEEVLHYVCANAEWA